jgi:uncharacterized protein involved in type VI secretion and phage assembly
MPEKNGDQFFGKYRGIVTDNQDPLKTGRIRAKVPDVLGDQDSGWALPCAPFGGQGLGFFAVPAVNSLVWFEFEDGDPDYPIWSGCWWASQNDMPSVLSSPAPSSGADPKVLIMTKGGHSILMDDSSSGGGITIQTSGGQKIVISDQGIELDNGKGAKIKLSGSQVSVNDGALEVS